MPSLLYLSYSTPSTNSLNFKDLVDGVEYNRYNRDGTSFAMRYKLKDGLLYRLMYGDWVLNEAQYNHLVDTIFEECEWTPKNGEYYFCPSYADATLHNIAIWKGDMIDKRIQRNVGIYQTKEGAIAKAKELGWT